MGSRCRTPSLALLLVAGCASTAVAPRTGSQVPVRDVDERGLWQLASENQESIERGGFVYPDPELEAYLTQVAQRLEPPEVFAAIPFRFKVVRHRVPNAFCLPNGAIYVHTGMLAMLESEAELAGILGHEMSHAVYRHALRQLHSAENKALVGKVLSPVTGGLAGPGGLIYLASVAGYSRDLEREADREGLARVSAAGYDARQVPAAFERMLAWVKAEKVPEGAGFYASHPRLKERIESTRALAQGAPPGEDGRERYQARTAPMLLDVGGIDLAQGRFAEARVEAERFVALRPLDARGHLLLGEIGRRESGAASDGALASYRRALELDPGLAPAWNGLGLLLRRKGDVSGAREALVRYLALAPGAPDREHVRAELRQLEGGTP